MSASKKITLHLGKKNVKFEVVKHKKVYTAYDLAQTAGSKLEHIAKTLLIKAELPSLKKKKNSQYYVVVVPASYYVDLKKVKKALKATKIEIATEKMMKKLGIKPGALTPFGSLRKLGVAIDKNLAKTKERVLVGAESFTESLLMKAQDLIKAEESLVADLGKKANLKLQKARKVVKKISKRPVKKPGKKVAKKKRS